MDLKKNKWFFKRYMDLNQSGGNSALIPSWINLANKTSDSSMEVNDAAYMNSFDTDWFIAHAYTNVYFSQDKDISFNYQSDDASRIYINGVEQYQGDYYAPRVGTVNLIENSELQMMTGWTFNVSGANYDATMKFGASGAIKIDIAGNATDSWWGAYSNFTPCVEGDVFFGSVSTRTDDLSTDVENLGWACEIEFFNEAGTRIAQGGMSIKPTAINEWQRFTSGARTAPAGAVKARFRVHARRNGRFWISKPMLEKASSPTSYYPSMILSFKKGWNTVDILMHDGTGGSQMRWSNQLSSVAEDMGYIGYASLLPLNNYTKAYRNPEHILQPVGHGQITIADYTDVPSATAYISSNVSRTQVVNLDDGVYTPNWSTTNPVLTPSLFLSADGTNTDKITSAKSIRWYDSNSPLISLTTAGDYVVGTVAQKGTLTIKNNILTGTTKSKTYFCEIIYTDPDTGFDIQVRAEYTFSSVNNGAKGDDAVALSIMLPEGNIFKNGSSDRLSAEATVYEAGSIVTPYSTRWFIRYPGAADEGAGVGWKMILPENQFDLGIEGVPTSSKIYITPKAVLNVAEFKLKVTHRGKDFYDNFTIVDTTDPIKVSVISSKGDIFKNGSIDTVLKTYLYRNGEELDVDGTNYVYKWTKYLNTGAKDETFSKTGKSLAITASDVATRATFTVDILEKVQTYGRNWIPHSGNFTNATDDWIGNGTTNKPKLVEKDGFSVIEMLGGYGLNGRTITNVFIPGNTEFTYSVEFMCNQDLDMSDINQPIHFQVVDGTQLHAKNLMAMGGDKFEPNKWVRRWVTFRTWANGGIFKPLIWDSPAVDDRIFWMKNMQLEEGLQVSPWSPHWRDDGAMIVGNKNHLYNLTGEKNYTNTNIGWDNTKNGTFGINGWSIGYSSQVASPELGYHAHWNKDKFGYVVIEMINRNSEIGVRNRWLGMTQTLSGTFLDGIQPGKTYTISCEVMSDTVGTGIHAGVYHWQIGGSARTFGNNLTGFERCKVPNVWEKKSFTFTIEKEWDTSRRDVTIYVYGSYVDVEGSSWIRNLKLEDGDNATQWTPHVSDNLPVSVYDLNENNKNLVVNGSFEDTTKKLEIVNGATAVYVTDGLGVDGGKYIRIITPSTASSGFMLLDLPTVPGRQYTMSGYAKSASNAQLDLRITKKDWIITSRIFMDTTNVWKRFSFTFVAQEENQRFLAIKPSDQFWLDNLQLEEGPIATVFKP